MKSPLKSKPLRNPGESVDQQVRNVLLDDIFQYQLFAMIFSFVAAIEWWQWYMDSPPTPVPYSVFAFVAVVVAVIKTRKGFKKVDALKLGRDGEKAVGQFLDGLRGIGAQVFHDVPADTFNLDHVVIHKSGIYVIETKTISKPDNGDPRLVFNGESITKDGHHFDRDPIKQVRAARGWLSETLRLSTGKNFPIRPVVVFPGWYIQPTAEAKSSNVWVLNPKALPSFIAHSDVQLTREDVNLCSFHLSRYIRTFKK